MVELQQGLLDWNYAGFASDGPMDWIGVQAGHPGKQAAGVAVLQNLFKLFRSILVRIVRDMVSIHVSLLRQSLYMHSTLLI